VISSSSLSSMVWVPRQGSVRHVHQFAGEHREAALHSMAWRARRPPKRAAAALRLALAGGIRRLLGPRLGWLLDQMSNATGQTR
jgi:hypothetical protein